MNLRATTAGSIDKVAIALSGLCLVHCLATALIIGAVSSVGGVLGSALIHETGLAIAIVLGAVALGRGMLAHRRLLPSVVGVVGLSTMAAALFLPHGGGEVAMTVVGVMLLAIGHMLNRAASA